MKDKLYFKKKTLLIILIIVTKLSNAQFMLPTTDTNFYDIVNHYGSIFQSMAPLPCSAKSPTLVTKRNALMMRLLRCTRNDREIGEMPMPVGENF